MSEEEQLLQAGWVYTTIGDVTYKKVDQIERSCPLTYIDIGSVDNLSKSIKDPNQLTQADKVPSRARQVVATNDVLVSMTRPNLNAVTIVPQQFENSIASTGFDVLRAIEVEPRWLFNIVKSNHFIESMSQIVQGALYPAVRPSDIRGYKIPLPPLNEQRRIVAKIEQLQERSRKAREALAEVGSLLEQFRQSLLAAAFRGDLTADWRAANPNVEPASELLNRIRQERREKWGQSELVKYEGTGKQPPKGWQDKFIEPAPLNAEELDGLHDQSLPEGWIWAPAESIVAPESDIVYGIVQPGTPLDEGVPYVRGKDIVDGTILIEQLLKTSQSIAARYERASLKGGDILLGIIRATKVAIVPDVLDGANITQGTARFRPSSIIRTKYLAGWLASPFAQNWLHAHYRGIDMPGLNLRDVRRLPVPIAPLAEQEAIELKIESSIAMISNATKRVTESESDLTQLDQSILAKAFRGELVPQDPSDEPASELLARIRRMRDTSERKKNSGPGKATKITKRKSSSA